MKYTLWIVLGALLLWILLPGKGDEEIIEEMIDAIVQKGSFEGEIHPLERITFAKEITADVEDGFVLHLATTERELTPLKSKNELQQKIIFARTHLAQLAVGFFEREIAVRGSKAVVTGRARGMGRSNGREDYFLEEHMVSIELQKLEGKWVILQAKNINPIEWPYE